VESAGEEDRKEDGRKETRGEKTRMKGRAKNE